MPRDDTANPASPGDQASWRSLALIGMPGVGKSSVAAALSAHLGITHSDLDDLVEAEAGRRIPEIFAAEGEEGFRGRELAALRSALSAARGKAMVLACGGGVTTRPATVTELRGAGVACVWLTASLDVLAARVGDEPGTRPLLDDADAESGLAELYARRRRSYLLASDLVVATDSIAPRAVAGIVAERLTLPDEADEEIR